MPDVVLSGANHSFQAAPPSQNNGRLRVVRPSSAVSVVSAVSMTYGFAYVPVAVNVNSCDAKRGTEDAATSLRAERDRNSRIAQWID